MSEVEASIIVKCFATLPDDEDEADKAFDELCDGIDRVLNDAAKPGLVLVPHVWAQSFSVVDGSTVEANV
jgi:hypothetical protein